MIGLMVFWIVATIIIGLIVLPRFTAAVLLVVMGWTLLH